MLGDKNSFVDDISIRSSGTEGSLRNHLTVWGPGVPSGAVSNVLLSLSDILPTMAELANATNTQHMPWSGMSFANLLVPDGTPTVKQQNRFLFTFVVSGADGQCPQADRLMSELLPDLDSNR
jgi:arylsulfatase A-like enzyme